MSGSYVLTLDQTNFDYSRSESGEFYPEDLGALHTKVLTVSYRYGSSRGRQVGGELHLCHFSDVGHGMFRPAISGTIQRNFAEHFALGANIGFIPLNDPDLYDWVIDNNEWLFSAIASFPLYLRLNIVGGRAAFGTDYWYGFASASVPGSGRVAGRAAIATVLPGTGRGGIHHRHQRAVVLPPTCLAVLCAGRGRGESAATGTDQSSPTECPPANTTLATIPWGLGASAAELSPGATSQRQSWCCCAERPAPTRAQPEHPANAEARSTRCRGHPVHTPGTRSGDIGSCPRDGRDTVGNGWLDGFCTAVRDSRPAEAANDILE